MSVLPILVFMEGLVVIQARAIFVIVLLVIQATIVR